MLALEGSGASLPPRPALPHLPLGARDLPFVSVHWSALSGSVRLSCEALTFPGGFAEGDDGWRGDPALLEQWPRVVFRLPVWLRRVAFGMRTLPAVGPVYFGAILSGIVGC